MTWRLAYPWLLLLLLLLPVAIAWLRRRGRREATVVVGDARAFDGLPVTWRQRLRRLPIILRLLVLCLFVVAAARPQGGKTSERVASEGIDIVLTLDMSGSMQAVDVEPGVPRRRWDELKTRVETAKAVTADFIVGREGDRLGLVLFGESAVTQCPLTIDREVVTGMVQAAELGMLGDRTAIGEAIGVSVNRLREAPGKSRVIVLLTDGNNNTGDLDPVTAAGLAKTYDIKIYAIGVGSRDEAYVRVDTFFGPDYRRMPDLLDEQTLQKAADATGGKYFRATSGQALEKIFAEIDQLEKTEVERERTTRYQDRFAVFLWLGLGLLLLETLLVTGPLRKVV